MPKGSCVIFLGHTRHSGGENTSGDPRPGTPNKPAAMVVAWHARTCLPTSARAQVTHELTLNTPTPSHACTRRLFCTHARLTNHFQWPISKRDLPGLNVDYCLSWLRQETNQYLDVPPTVARTLPEKLQVIHGMTHNTAALQHNSVL